MHREAGRHGAPAGDRSTRQPLQRMTNEVGGRLWSRLFPPVPPRVPYAAVRWPRHAGLHASKRDCKMTRLRGDRRPALRHRREAGGSDKDHSLVCELGSAGALILGASAARRGRSAHTRGPQPSTVVPSARLAQSARIERVPAPRHTNHACLAQGQVARRRRQFARTPARRCGGLVNAGATKAPASDRRTALLGSSVHACSATRR
jgi:hypothetical protein